MIIGNNLTKRYDGIEAVNDVTIALSPGEVVMLLGRNGSGKSTLIKVLALATQPDHGSVSEDALSDRNARTAIGYVPQEIALFEDLSVWENLRCFAPSYTPDPSARIKETMEALALTDIRRKLIKSLSGGQKRRVNLAAALLGTPQYLILDEPLAGVDVQSEERIMTLLHSYKAGGCGILISSHQPRQLRSLADRALLLEAGNCVFWGTAAEYYANLAEREI